MFEGVVGYCNRPNAAREKVILLRVHLTPAIGRLRLDKVRGATVSRLFAVLRNPGAARGGTDSG